MRATRLTSEDIASHIREAGDTCLLITPGVDGIVANALRERAQHPTTKASVVIDGSHHAERSGYGETSTWRDLMDVTELKAMPGTRLGLLVTDRGAWLFAPRAGRLDPREEEGLSAVMLGAHCEEARALSERIVGRTSQSPRTNAGAGEGHSEDLPEGRAHDEDEPKAMSATLTKKDVEQAEIVGRTSQPPQTNANAGEEHSEYFPEGRVHDEDEPRAMSDTITKEAVEQAEKAIEEHPPRDYAKEREVSVYTAFVGYIEMRLVGASLGKGARLKIPNELVERGLGENEVRKRINESVKINLEEDVDTGVREINERLNAMRTLYTRQLGEPHGRIYRKRQRMELEGHLKDLRKEIARANLVLEDKIETALRRQLDDLAETFSRQTAQGGLPELKKEEMSRLLLKTWHEAGAVRRREVKLEVTFKDLTWETLQDATMRERIVEQFPDLENSTLYREYRAHTPTAKTRT